MATQSSPKSRSRSNSFQMMLDLEKKLMRERSQGTPTQSSFPSSPSTSHKSLPTPPATQQRRFELVPRKAVPEDSRKAPVPVRNYSDFPAPLTLGGSQNQGEMSEPTHRRAGSQPHTIKAIPPPPAQPGDRSPPKNVAFMFPPDVEEIRSICQSPSWEAYDRRKKEKAESKRERRDERRLKEQAIQESKPRGRKLSKAPPLTPYTAPALGDRSMSELEIPVRQIQPKPRPSSVLGIPIHRQGDEHRKEKAEKPAKPEKAEKPEKKRRRSSSLTSLIRSSFEIRRPSFDRDTPFIGGVKLEQGKEEFHQQVLEDQAKGNSKVHPAFRKSFIGHGSFTPIKTPPQKDKESKRRACPPISIQAAAARKPGLLTPTSASPRKSDFTNIYLWSSRASRGAQSDDECAVVDDSEVEDSRGHKSSPTEQSDHHNSKGGLARSGGIYVKSSPPPQYDTAFSPETHGERGPTSADDRTSIVKSESTKQMRPSSSQTSKQSQVSRPPVTSPPKTRSRRGSLTSLFSIAPDPPKKSSKRNSLPYTSRSQASNVDESDNSEDLLKTLTNPYIPPNLELKRPVEDKQGQKSSPSNHKSDKMLPSSPPSIPYERTSAGARPKMYTSETCTSPNGRWTLRDAVNAAFRRGSSSQSSVASPMTDRSPHETEDSFNRHKRTDSAETSPIIDDRLRGHSRPSTSSTGQAHVRIPGEQLESTMPPSLGSWRPEMSSSEDESNSDAVPTVSPMSTPNTTPPQSEMDYPHSGGATIRKVNYNTHKRNSKSWSATDSPQLLTNARYEPSVTSTEASDQQYDPIQAAARQVMEAFPQTSQQQRSSNRGQDMNAQFHGKAMYPPLQLRDKSVYSPTSPSSPLSPQSPRVVLSKGHKSSRSTSEIPSKSFYQQPASTLSSNPDEPVAKMFVECCSCKYYHDMPSKLYEAMVNPDTVLSSTENLGFLGTVSMTVKCPWCKHEMSTRCCAGFAAMVYIQERLH